MVWAVDMNEWKSKQRVQGPAHDLPNSYLQVRYETQVFEESEALNKQFAEINKVYPALVRRTKVVQLDLMTVDEAIDAMEAVGHDFFVFR